jgi:hypothetical protein
MRPFLAALFLAFGALAGTAAVAAPKVAAISLLGDRLLVVGSQMQTGSRIDRNSKDYLPTNSTELDTATVLAFEREAKALRPQLDLVLLRASDATVHAIQDDVVAGKRDQRELLSAIAPLARRAGATHLVLFIKSRADVRIQMADGSIGAGFVEGLGFYIDRWTQVRRLDSGQEDAGVLAPFAYFKAVLVELDGLKVVGEESSHVARALYGKDSKAKLDPWDFLTANEKVQALAALSGEGLQKMVPRVLARL